MLLNESLVSSHLHHTFILSTGYFVGNCWSYNFVSIFQQVLYVKMIKQNVCIFPLTFMVWLNLVKWRPIIPDFWCLKENFWKQLCYTSIVFTIFHEKSVFCTFHVNIWIQVMVNEIFFKNINNMQYNCVISSITDKWIFIIKSW